MYLKLYLKPELSNEIILKKIYPLMLKLKKVRYIKEWFFIRYYDDGSHIRLRMLLSKNEFSSFILNSLNHQLHIYLHNGDITKILLDTYIREVERYGDNNFLKFEHGFYLNSETVCKLLLKETNSDKMAAIAVLCSDLLLDTFNLTSEKKIELCKDVQQSFFLEFNLINDRDKRIMLRKNTDNVLKTIDLLYQNDIEKILLDILRVERSHLHSLNLIENNLIIQSYIHMFINRFFHKNQRYEELNVYTALIAINMAKANRTVKNSLAI